MITPDEEFKSRFLEKVSFEPMSGCWIWASTYNRTGYASVRVGKNMRLAHRIAWEMFVSPIPLNMQVDHVCHNRACVNPEHLRLATPGENRKNRVLNVNSTSGFKGVHFCKSRGVNRWIACLQSDGKRVYLGLFDTPEDAYVAYCESAKKLHGKFFCNGSAA